MPGGNSREITGWILEDNLNENLGWNPNETDGRITWLIPVGLGTFLITYWANLCCKKFWWNLWTNFRSFPQENGILGILRICCLKETLGKHLKCMITTFNRFELSYFQHGIYIIPLHFKKLLFIWVCCVWIATFKEQF